MNKAKVIVVGHGKFASSLQNSLELFVGKQKEENFIDFTKEMSEADLYEKISKQINDGEVVIFTDLVGGTPYKKAAEIAYKNKKVGVVSGCNLSSLLETTYKEYKNKEEFMQDLVDITKKTAQIFEKDDASEINENDDFSDGI
ncbi:PTS system, N-acetylgalactosamine-specific IIA component [Lactobacillus apis]|uniref:PTS sugar transporter subunit IIA n=1 Tax=Lactobacillus apis TaxID=303541 RepID=UPI000815C1EE|nr:PTS sugar transporter subunit IIA [Lactobacillus apis]GGG40642.1 putative PTS dependent N-acetyl-galactosamine-and galactosamine IIA component [Lactobacillus apis]SCB95796.1 PTS system, N-acetylgalactosamine-specific IIA component [Lactobacillus apis]